MIFYQELLDRFNICIIFAARLIATNFLNKFVKNFFIEIVAGVKKGFTFALPITTKGCKIRSRTFFRETLK